MKLEEGYFQGHNGFKLFWQSWSSQDKTTAALVLVHGYGEYSSRYSCFVDRLTAAGIAVFAFDHRGHGNSDGKYAHIDSFADYRGDVAAFKQLVESKVPDIPLFLYGHSMGSLIVLDFELRGPGGFKGVITSGAGFEPGGVAKPWLVFLTKKLSKIWPTFPLPMKVEGNALSRDQVEIEDYDKDKKVRRWISARWGDEMLKAIQWIGAHAHDVQWPLLMLHGEADHVNFASGSQSFISKVKYPDASIKLYPDCLHDIHRDLDKEKVLTDLIDWINVRS